MIRHEHSGGGCRSGGAPPIPGASWAGFLLAGWDVHGSKDSRLHGHFTQIIWEGIASESADASDFGARAVSLVE